MRMTPVEPPGGDEEPPPQGRQRQDQGREDLPINDDGMEPSDKLLDATSRLLVDPGHMLRCMRVWLSQASDDGGIGRQGPRGRGEGGDGGDAITAEEASCMLWDLTANEECAAFMVQQNRAFVLVSS